jgi:hypothetical protein
MNQLYPIIRRKRRPLVVAESVPDGPPKPPVVVGEVVTVPAVATTPVETVVPEAVVKTNDANATQELDA